MKSIGHIVLLAVLVFSCQPLQEEKRSDQNLYADRFSINEFNKFDILTIYDPWQRSSGSEINYILSDNLANIPDSIPDLPFIKIPVEKVVVFSTTHIGFISSLGHVESIKGVSGLKYVCDTILRKGIENNQIFEIGFAPNIDYERILSLKPDLVFLYGLESSITGIMSRLQSSGIPVVLIAEYLEDHPLGKMEWIKVFGKLYGEEYQASEIFENAKNEYEKYSMLADSAMEKPEVLTGLPWKDTWYISGGKSITARFIEDAGGEYLWKDNSSREFIPLSLEAVLAKAIQADIWINTGSARTLDEIEGRDLRFSNLEVYRRGLLYNNDALLQEDRGNPFWEKGVVEPHIILQDLINIFHPGAIETHDFVYYRKLE